MDNEFENRNNDFSEFPQENTHPSDDIQEAEIVEDSQKNQNVDFNNDEKYSGNVKEENNNFFRSDPHNENNSSDDSAFNYTNGENKHTHEFTVNHTVTKKSGHKWQKVVSLCLVGGIVFGIAFGFANSITTKFAMKHINIGTTNVALTQTKDKANLPASDISVVAESFMPAIVAITNKSVSDVMTFFGKYSQESTSSGSGIIIGKNDTELLIVTNYHVVANSKELSVIFSSVEKQLELQNAQSDIKNNPEKPHSKSDLNENPSIPQATVKGYNSDKDLAVIAVQIKDIPSEVLSEIKVATIGDSSLLKPGDQVIAIGNALGYGQSVTTGIISAVNRQITMESADGTSQVTNSFIQTDTAINPGNSGGALINMAGEVIGINSVKISANGVEGMGYAIPITDVGNIIDELMVKETRSVVPEDKQGFLGITGADVSSSATQAYGIPAGVFVNSVMEGLAAERAGFKKGYVITKFDGYTITSITQLQDRLTYYKSGEKVKVTVQIPSGVGEYKEKDIDVILSNRAKNVNKELPQEENR